MHESLKPPDYDPSPPERGVLSMSPAVAALAILIVILLAYFLIQVQSVVILVILAILFGTVIERPVNFLERRRLPRGLSILLVYICIFGGVVLAAYALAPSIRHEADVFRAEAPVELRSLQDTWSTSSIAVLSGPGVDGLNRAILAIQDPPEIPHDTAIGVASNVGTGLIESVTVLVMAFYYLMEKGFLRNLAVSRMRPARQFRTNRLLDKVNLQVGHWMRGQLTLCLVIGIMTTIGYGIMGVPFWPLLGLFAGLTEAIPIVGPFIGAVPAVVMALTVSWQLAVAVAIFASVIQLTENWILVPKIMKGAVGLTPLTVFVAILVGAEYLGVIGALLALPIAAVVQVLVSELLLPSREPQTAGGRMPSWRWMRQQAGDFPEADSDLVQDVSTRPVAPEPTEFAWQSQRQSGTGIAAAMDAPAHDPQPTGSMMTQRNPPDH